MNRPLFPCPICGTCYRLHELERVHTQPVDGDGDLVGGSCPRCQTAMYAQLRYMPIAELAMVPGLEIVGSEGAWKLASTRDLDAVAPTLRPAELELEA